MEANREKAQRISWNDIKGGLLCMVVGVVLLVWNNALGNYFGYGLLAIGFLGIVWGVIQRVRSRAR